MLRELRNNYSIHDEVQFDPEGFRKSKQQAIFLLRMSFFILAITTIQSLSVFGYVHPFTRRVQSWLPWIGQGVILVLSYALTPIVSGVMGNVAYDLLKRIVRNMRNSRK
jgi:hypothetical protein